MEVYEQVLWLPFLAAVAAILFSLFVFTKFFNNNNTNTTAVADDTTSESESVSSSSSNPNSSSTSNPLPSAPFEVFLSFRGPDTRLAFTDFLYNDLDDARVRTFRDDNELRKGEEIGPELLKAITESKISIPIFSKNYASSKWCLRELAKMWECRASMGQLILPIFYDVEPTDVRHQTGDYEQAFKDHEKHFDGETVQGWRKALGGVGALKGYELKKETGGHQGKLVKKVVTKVLLELKQNYMVVTDKLVAIDHHIEKMTRKLNVDSTDVKIVGVYGMGGLGKTTIAKVIYNKLSEGFEHTCFLADVRETSQQKGLVNLQNQLNSRILKRKGLDIDDINDGIQMTKNTVSGKKVLIVLDDVAEMSQFEVLAGKREWYGSGSRIIVTTRNKKILDDLEAEEAYEPPTMDPYYSLQLFSKHAFRMDFPPEDYVLLSTQIASTAAGLPLALEIIGSLLSGMKKAAWKDTLEKLRTRPEDKVEKILRISYDALEYEQKQIFLDIACLPIGVDKETAFYMWNACKFFPESGIEFMLLMSLVKISDGGFLYMHDQLVLLAREIVRQENMNEPEERSRLWDHEEVTEVLEGRKGTKNIQVLCSENETGHPGLCFTSEVFTGLSNLRVCKVDCAELTGDFKRLLLKLRWLHWHKCPGEFSPTNFHLKNMVILDLSKSSITDNWQAWSQIKMAVKLKVLDLSFCKHLTRTPDFSTFGSLERLILRECTSMIHIDPSIGNLTHLRVLDISGSAITTTPDLSTFGSLERLILRWCKNITHIDPSIGNLIYLRVLDISHSAITMLPDAFGNLKELEVIDASSCSLQGEIPSSIGSLSSLKTLKLDSTEISQLPVSMCGLCNLETLDLYSCRNLQSVPPLPPSLTSLRVTCKRMEAFPCLPNLTSLKTLTLEDCGITILPEGVGGLFRLNKLQILSCEKLGCIMGLPSGLQRLSIYSCKSLKTLPDLSNLEILLELNVFNCPELVENHGLGKLKQLTSLQVLDCPKVCKLDGLEQLEFLIHLDIRKCYSLERLPDLSNLKKLKKFLALGCHKLMEIRGLEQLESLEYLDLQGCNSVEIFPRLSLEHMGMLKDLVLAECHKLVKAEGLWISNSLERLEISFCKGSKTLPDLSNLKSLKELRIRGWMELTEIQGLEKLKSLEHLNITGCESLEKLPDISNLSSLITLIAVGCRKLIEIPGLESLKSSLRELQITGCILLKDLPHLPNTKIRQHSPSLMLSMERYHGLEYFPEE